MNYYSCALVLETCNHFLPLARFHRWLVWRLPPNGGEEHYVVGALQGDVADVPHDASHYAPDHRAQQLPSHTDWQGFP